MVTKEYVDTLCLKRGDWISVVTDGNPLPAVYRQHDSHGVFFHEIAVLLGFRRLNAPSFVVYKNLNDLKPIGEPALMS